MKKIKLLITAAMLLISVSVFSQTGRAYWQPVSSVKNPSSRVAVDKLNLNKLQLFELDVKAIQTQLVLAPKSRIGINSSGTIIGFPNPDGSFGSYRVTENSAMDPALQDKYPDIRSYVGKGIEDPTAIIYFSVSPLGLQTMLLRADNPVILIEPYTTDLSTYVVYKKGDRTSFSRFECNTVERGIDRAMLNTITSRPNADDALLRTFRLALSATGEYTAYFGGTVVNALAALNNTVTRVNGIDETDFGVHFNLVANNDLLIYTNAATDPYASTITNQQVQTTITNVIGEANYDMGEVFGIQNQGGNAGCIGCVCVSGAKGSGFTTLPNPTGDAFDIDIVAHEFGHTLGANHTFGFRYEGTGAQMEPGSGITIMGYAGITGSTDIAPHSYAYFHAISIQQVTNNIKAKTCSVNTPTGNAIPAADAGPDYIIPKGTPFILTGAGTDANDAGLLYSWEQMDAMTSTRSFPGVSDADGPEFRNFNLSSSNTRTFPEINTVLAGATSSTWEAVPNVARTMNFRFTVRDNHAGGPANNSDDVVITTAASGPFVVTVPNTAVSWAANSTQTITWDVAGTTAAPVSCTNVKISLSTDGGLTFPTVLLASTPNDGTQAVTLPNLTTQTARIKVEAVGNIFFDISNANFTINAVATTFNIVATSGANGTVTPAGTTSVASGASQTYTITPTAGYAVAIVLVDGASVGAVTSYTFTNVTAAHTISASFVATTQQLASNAGSNVTIVLPISSVTLDGSASTGNIAQYYWYQAQGPVSSAIGSSFSSVTTASGLTTAGTYVFGLQVKDNNGATAYSYKTVTISPAVAGSVPACVTNSSPANATTIATQTTATLTWPASATAASYDVYLAAGTGIPTTLVTNATSLTYSATGLTAGTTYSWFIAPRNASGVNTTCGSTNKTTFTTAVAGNQPLTSNAGSNVTIVLPTSSVTLDGSASTGNIVQYYWYQAQGPVQSVIGNNFASGTTAAGLTTAGTYVFGLQVKDNTGATAYSYKTVIVNPAGTGAVPSCVTNTSPANASTLGTQTTATLTWPASATATSYDVYLWTGATTPAFPTTNTTALTYNATGLTAGTTYSWYIAPRNAIGAATGCATSNKTTFTTAAPGNLPTTSNAGSNVSITLPTSSVTLDGSASTGNIVQYYWYQAQGPVQSAIGNNFLSVTNAAGLTTAGTYVFGLQVKDNTGALAYSYKTVTVKAAGSATDPAVLKAPSLNADESSSLPSVTAVINPNPVVTGKQAKLQINSNKAGTVMVNIVSGNGVIIGTRKVNLVAGINTTTVSTAGLAQGFHIISISGAAKPLNIKLIVQ